MIDLHRISVIMNIPDTGNVIYCHSIVRGTMMRMKQLDRTRGHPISDYHKISPALC